MANNPTTRAQQWARFLETKGWLSSTSLPAVVGTVSQTAGAPTGNIVERGSNANGEYVKFADGTMICWGTVVGLAPSAAVGQVFTSDVITATFPVAFASATSMAVSAGASVTTVWCNTNGTSASATSFRIFSPVSNATVYNVKYVAVGRWF